MASVNKTCKCCGSQFEKRPRDSVDQWNRREFCSILCSNKSKSAATPLSERFWKFVSNNAQYRCWEWLGSKDRRGYGRISTSRGRSPMKAHRASWEIHFGTIPHGLNVCHACDNPACVNPSHLLLGTQMANSIDMSRKGRINHSSFLNLQPGRRGVHGAGGISNKEIANGVS